VEPGPAHTSPARTVTDLAPFLGARALERGLDEALTRQLTSVTAINQALEDYPHRPGAPNLRALLDPDRPTTVTRSDGEEAFLAMIRRANLPAPEVNARVGDYVADFLWREQKLIVELDGYQYHHTRPAFEHDHQRDAQHQHQGFTVIRITGRQLQRQPEALAIQIATALSRAS
jgi:very-short-patch-repair endonuclease